MECELYLKKAVKNLNSFILNLTSHLFELMKTLSGMQQILEPDSGEVRTNKLKD